MTNETKVWMNTFRGKPGTGAQMRQLVKGMVPGLLQVDGCESMRVFAHPEQDDWVVSMETWQTVEAHDAHVQRMIDSGILNQPEMAILEGMDGTWFHPLA